MKPQEISVTETSTESLDSASYSETTDVRWWGRWMAIGLCSVPLSAPAMNDKSMVSWIAEGEHSDTVHGVTENETVTDEMLLREMERIAWHLSQARPELDQSTVRALYSNPEQLYL